MRTLIFLVSMISLAYGNIGQDDAATETARSITVSFASGSATFSLANGVVKTIDVRVGEKLYTTQLSGCTPVTNIRFETAQFFEGLPGRRVEGTFTLSFRMGTEDSGVLTQLPWVQIAFSDGHRADAIIARQTATDLRASSVLCAHQNADPSAR